MDRLKLILVFTLFISLSACAPTIKYEGIIDLTRNSKTTRQHPTSLEKAIEKQKALIEKRSSYARPEWYAQLAYLYDMNRQFDEAIAAAKRAIELKEIWSAFHNLGYAYQGKNQYHNALAAYRKALQLKRDPVTFNQVGRVYLALMDYDSALTNFKEASKLDPRNDIYLLLISICHYRMGQYKDALDAINKAISAFSYGTLGMKVKVRKVYDIVKYRVIEVTEVEKGGPADEAGIKVGSTLALGGIKANDFKISLQDIEKYFKTLKPGATVEIWATAPGPFQFPHKKLLKVERVPDPNRALKLAVKAEILAIIGKSQESRKLAEESLSDETSNETSEGWARIALARTYLKARDYRKAKEILSGTSTTKAKILKALALANMGRNKQARFIYLAIPDDKLTPKKVPLWNDRNTLLCAFKPVVIEYETKARELADAGLYQQALEKYANAFVIAEDNKAKELRNEMFQLLKKISSLPPLPEDAHRCIVRGKVLIKDGDFGRAVLEFRKAIRLAPYFPKLYFNTALVEGKAGNYEKAICNMKTYLEFAPEAPDARAAKDQIYKWELLMEEQNAQE
ncbi:MAG TPA: tetratricopeptide repeat protein [Desulfobacterales bacterium]|nr:tetratricopeptide repeat protein [Desulfobacterales bacterium]